jgi:asparagine synthase (glutamine-hydrolysing)
MCGIAGCLRVDGAPVTGTTAIMVERLLHRGPDDRGQSELRRTSGSGAIGATRLAIQDLSPGGHQPMESDTGVVVALNGEIYNAHPLRRELEGRGHAFRGRSDTEVLLRAYEEWGAACLARLRGMFAFAVWDARSQQLFLARDRLGIKPLYYHHGPDGFLFASELRSLLSSDMVPRRLDPEAMASFLRVGGVVEPASMVAGVSMLPPGCVLTYQGHDTTVHRYWSLVDAFSAEPPELSYADLCERLREELLEVSTGHLVGDVPVAVFLSGGIDSSALAALLARTAANPPNTFCLTFAEEQFSEGEFAKLVADRAGTRHVDERLPADEFLASLPHALDAMDQPTVDGVNTFMVSRRARAAGLKVAVSGVGSDELFAGYDTFRALPKMLAVERATSAAMRRRLAPLARRAVRSEDRAAKLEDWMEGRGGAYASFRGLFSVGGCRRLLGDVSADMFTGSGEAMALRDPTNEVSRLELTSYMQNVLLRDADVMSMAAGLELRVPFLDHELVELVAPVPGHVKLQRGRQKPLLVDALGEMLPREVVERRKQGFTMPFEPWMRGPLRKGVDEMLRDRGRGGAVASHLDGREVEATWDAFESGAVHWSRPWALYVLKSWGERHLPTA